MIAVIGLAIYAAFLYAAILLLNVTLTLPGFAGLILTIGVAADANVVIFERIKEEVRVRASPCRPRSPRGYQRGFHTIVDANVVTCITAFVLFAAATAQVKGFALMLLLGTVISLVTAVAATRAMLGLLAGFRWFDNPRFMGATGQTISKLAADRRHAAEAAAALAPIAARRDRRQRVVDRRQGPEPRHRLQGRHAGHVQDAEADLALDSVRDEMGKIDRAERRGRPGARQARPAATGTRASRSGRSR